MDPQLLIASLYEHTGSMRNIDRTSGQHDMELDHTEGARFDTAGVVIAILAMIGLMIAMALMGDGGGEPQPSSMSHFLMSNR